MLKAAMESLSRAMSRLDGLRDDYDSEARIKSSVIELLVTVDALLDSIDWDSDVGCLPSEIADSADWEPDSPLRPL